MGLGLLSHLTSVDEETKLLSDKSQGCEFTL